MDNCKHPGKLDVTFFETLTESDIHLLDTQTDTDQRLKTANSCSTASASDISCSDTCYSHTDHHTSPTCVCAVTTENDLQRLKDKNKNQNTAKSTVTWIKRFEAWRKVKEITRELENIPEDELDTVLQSFFGEIRKNDGTEYEPECLRVMLSALDRHLKDKG